MKKFLDFTKTSFKKAKKLVAFGLAACTMGLMTAQPVSASTVVVTNLDSKQVVGGILDVIFEIAMYIGIVLGVIGVFQFIMAMKDDNAEQQTRGIRLAIVGIALIGLRILIKTAGFIK